MPAQDTATAVAGAAPGPRVDRRLLDGRLVTPDKAFPSRDPAAGAVVGRIYQLSEDPGEMESRGMRHHREMGVAGLEESFERKTFAVPVPGVSA